MGPVIEEWDLLGYREADLHRYWFSYDTVRFGEALRFRPFVLAPYSLADLLGPNTFYGWHIVLLTMLIIRSLSFHAILRQWMTRQTAIIWALVASVHPADTQLFTFRSIPNTHALAYLSVAIILTCGPHSGPQLRGSIRFFAIITGIAAVGIYPPSIAVIAAGFFVAISRCIFVSSDIHARTRAADFAALISVVMAYYGWCSITDYSQGYDKALVGGISASRVAQNFVTISLPRALVGGWIDAAVLAWSETTILFKIASTLLVVIGTLIPNTHALPFLEKAPGDHSRQFTIRIIFLESVGLLSLGVFPVSALGSHIGYTERNYLAATLGATVLVWTGIQFIRNQIVGHLLTAFLLAIGSIQGLYQYKHYAALSSAQASVLAEVSQTIIGQVNLLRIIDYTGFTGSTWTLGPGMKWALQFTSGYSVGSVEYCFPATGILRSYEDLSLETWRACTTSNFAQTQLEENSIAQMNGGSWAKDVSYACVDWATFQETWIASRCGATAGGAVPAVYPERLSWITHVASRAGDWSGQLFETGKSPVSKGYSFSRYWGFEPLPFVSGLRDIEFLPVSAAGIDIPFIRSGMRWTNSASFAISLGRLYGGHNYKIIVGFLEEMNSAWFEHWVWMLNSQPIHCTLVSGTRVECDLPTVVTDIHGQIVTSGVIPPHFRSGIHLKSLRIIDSGSS